MKSALKIILIGAALLLCLGVGLFEYAYSRDQAQFQAARNDCERGCIQDSGGIASCRPYCAQHPDHYP